MKSGFVITASCLSGSSQRIIWKYLENEEVTQKGASAYDNIDIVGIFVVIVGSVRLLQALSWGRRLRLTFAVAGALPGAALNSIDKEKGEAEDP